MEKENLLYKIDMPIQEILNRVNWCVSKISELKSKYTIKDNSFFNLSICSSIGLYNTNGSNLDGIFAIEETYKSYRVEGYYNTSSRTVTYPTPAGSMDEGWRIERSEFKENSSANIPTYLFKLSLEEVYKKMDEEFKQDFKERYNIEIEHWDNQIKQANQMISKVKVIGEQFQI